MKVLVTGHQGYIGSVLVRQLKEHGYQIIGLDSGFFSEGILGPEPVSPDRTIQKDIRHIEIADLESVDAVIHLAALSDDPMGELHPQLTDKINRCASTQLARMVREAGISRFLYASSSSVYGSVDVNEPIDETFSTNPITAYAKSKRAAEKEIMQLARKDFSPVFLRSATVYGPSPRIRFCTLVVHNLMGCAISTGTIRIKSDGTPWRPLVHVEDLCSAFLAALKAPRERIHNRIFNVGQDSQNFQVKEIAETVRQTVPGAVIEYTGEHCADQRSYRVSFETIAGNLPDFRPRWRLAEGCEELYGFLKDNHFTSGIFEDRRFLRLKQIRHLMSRKLVDNKLFWMNGKAGDIR